MNGNGNGRANLTAAAMAAAAFTPWAENHWHVQVSADQVLYVAAGALAAWHGIASTLGPYAKRMFDHYFPPAVPAIPTTPPPAAK